MPEITAHGIRRRMFRTTALIAVVLAATLGMILPGVSPPAHAAGFPYACDWDLNSSIPPHGYTGPDLADMEFQMYPWNSNFVFPVGVGMCASATASYGGAEWVLLPDGNFVIYNSFGQQIWQSRTDYNKRTNLVFQPDGNLVDYLGSSPSWATGTNGASDPTLCFQDDGNMVIYENGGQGLCSGQVVWASNT